MVVAKRKARRPKGTKGTKVVKQPKTVAAKRRKTGVDTELVTQLPVAVDIEVNGWRSKKRKSSDEKKSAEGRRDSPINLVDMDTTSDKVRLILPTPPSSHLVVRMRNRREQPACWHSFSGRLKS